MLISRKYPAPAQVDPYSVEYTFYYHEKLLIYIASSTGKHLCVEKRFPVYIFFRHETPSIVITFSKQKDMLKAIEEAYLSGDAI